MRDLREEIEALARDWMSPPLCAERDGTAAVSRDHARQLLAILARASSSPAPETGAHSFGEEGSPVGDSPGPAVEPRTEGGGHARREDSSSVAGNVAEPQHGPASAPHRAPSSPLSAAPAPRPPALTAAEVQAKLDVAIGWPAPAPRPPAPEIRKLCGIKPAHEVAERMDESALRRALENGSRESRAADAYRRAVEAGGRGPDPESAPAPRPPAPADEPLSKCGACGAETLDPLGHRCAPAPRPLCGAPARGGDKRCNLSAGHRGHHEWTPNEGPIAWTDPRPEETRPAAKCICSWSADFNALGERVPGPNHCEACPLWRPEETPDGR